MRRTSLRPRSSLRALAAGLALVGLTVGAAACGSDDTEETSAGRGVAGRQSTTTAERDVTTGTGESSTTAPSTTTTAPSTTTTAEPTTTTSAPPAPPAPPPGPEADGFLRPGESGQAVLDLQNQLTELGYWLGPADAGYGDLTRQAVLAFQKAEGLDRDGIAGPATLQRLASNPSRPRARSTSGNLIEIDLARQLLFVIQNGQVTWVFNTSTGKSSTPTPPGNFTITREIDGYRHAELGVLYRPKYFNGGIAIHGYGSVPAYPASHGCSRVSNPAIDYLWASGYAAIGTPVWVY